MSYVAPPVLEPFEPCVAAPDGGPKPKHEGKIRARLAIEWLKANYSDFTVLEMNKDFTLKAEDAQGIADALKANTNLRELHLASNRLTTATAVAFGEMLKHNRGLKVLNLEDNKIETDGVTAIAKGLAYNKSLEQLNLFKNQEPGEGALRTLIESFDYNTTLLNINWRLTSRQSFTITKKLSRNKEILRRMQAGMDYSDIDPNLQRIKQNGGVVPPPSSSSAAKAPYESTLVKKEEKPNVSSRSSGTSSRSGTVSSSPFARSNTVTSSASSSSSSPEELIKQAVALEKQAEDLLAKAKDLRAKAASLSGAQAARSSSSEVASPRSEESHVSQNGTPRDAPEAEARSSSVDAATQDETVDE